MKNAILFAAVLYLVAPPVALPAPKATSPQECAVLADMALVARAAAKHQVERVKLEAMLPDIYSVGTTDGETLAALIVAAAYAAAAADVEPATFAEALGGGCMRSGGDLDAILGTGA
jgi:hypothetical protein